VKKWEHLIDTHFLIGRIEEFPVCGEVKGVSLMVQRCEASFLIVVCLIDRRMSKPIFDIVGSVVWWETGLTSGK